jgi:hypothetical protein
MGPTLPRSPDQDASPVLIKPFTNIIQAFSRCSISVGQDGMRIVMRIGAIGFVCLAQL